MRELPLAELLDRVAARTAAPGGGSAAATGGALAAALVEMAARFAPGTGSRAIAARAAELRRRALELAEIELTSYEAVLVARKLAPTDPARTAEISAASSAAADPPLELAAIAAELADLGAQVVGDGNPNLAGDAIAGVLLAEAACRAAAELVTINLAEVPGDPRHDAAAAQAARAAGARRQALPAGDREV